MSDTMSNTFQVGELVWVKDIGWPWWPATVADVKPDGNYWVDLFYRRRWARGPNDEIFCDVKSVAEISKWESKTPLARLGKTAHRVYSERDNADYRRAVDEARQHVAELEAELDGLLCNVCAAAPDTRDDQNIVICDGCEKGWHLWCHRTPLDSVPEGDWLCYDCTLARDPAAGPIARLVSRALENVRASARPPAADLLEVLHDHAWRPAAIAGRRTARVGKGDYVRFDLADAPAGAWLYYVKEDETLEAVVHALYALDGVAAAVCEVLLSFQRSQPFFSKDWLLPESAPLNGKLQAGTRVLLPEFTIARENETPGQLGKRFARDVRDRSIERVSVRTHWTRLCSHPVFVPCVVFVFVPPLASRSTL
jgi:hypothetical protein